MNPKTISVFFLFFLGYSASQLLGNDPSFHFIGAQAGLVNHVDGNPVVFTADQSVSTPLLSRAMIQPMSRIETGQNDRVEILLNPGSYLRIAENSIVRVNETKLDDVRVALDKGTLIVESGVFDKKVHSLVIGTAAGDIAIQKEGLYRFEADPQRPKVEVMVRRGKAQWLPEGRPQMALKSGKRFELPVRSGTDEFQVAKISKEQVDPLDQWSMRRAQYLVAASNRASSWASDSWYSSYYQRGFRGGWFFDPFFQMFTFIPFGSSYYSPYGFSYLGYNPYRFYRGGYGGGGGTSAPGNTGSVGPQSPSSPNNKQSGPTRGAPSSPMSRSSSIGSAVHSRGTATHHGQGR